MPEDENLIDTLDDAYNRAAVIERFEKLVKKEMADSNCKRKIAIMAVGKKMPRALHAIIAQWLSSKASQE